MSGLSGMLGVRFLLAVLMPLWLAGCTNSSTQCLAEAARDGHTRYQLAAISADCKRKYPMVDGPWVPFGPKAKATYNGGQCFRFRVSDEFFKESIYAQKRHFSEWISRQSAKSKKEHRCRFSLFHFLTGSFFY